ncbi:hypothetical protein A6A22_03225 [Arthrobacter sp. OY3WO11]|nr:hypothetical protein A6A22_03225 [Arthrobacter sp. OY3WO11]
MGILPVTARAGGRIGTLVGAAVPRPVVTYAIVGSVVTYAMVGSVAPHAIMGSVVTYAIMGAGPSDAAAISTTAISTAACVRGAVPRAIVADSFAVAAVPAVRVGITAELAVDVRVELIRLTRPFIYIVAERLGLHSLLVSLLAQPGCVHLGLFCIRPGARRLRFTLPGVKFLNLCLTADFCCLLPVFVVALLLDRLPAPSARQQQQHNQHHHHNGNYHPYPWSCFHVTHHFPLDVTGPACALPADSVGTV